MIRIPKIEKAGKVFWTIIGLAFLLLVGALDYVLVPHEVSVSLERRMGPPNGWSRPSGDRNHLKGAFEKDRHCRANGGDEFAILLPELGPAGAQAVLSKVHQMLLAGMKEENWPATFNIGALTFLHPPSSVDEMIHMAHSAMYEVRKTGKKSVKYSVFEGS
jgi:hypothetical protein